ncbi:hypothetical protein LMS41_06780 [Clostridium perfringens]|nr:hypothetical protein [Clostridium perfringens]MCC5420754.1 hypothetical protein [Clostridium perfringens]
MILQNIIFLEDIQIQKIGDILEDTLEIRVVELMLNMLQIHSGEKKQDKMLI